MGRKDDDWYDDYDEDGSRRPWKKIVAALVVIAAIAVAGWQLRPDDDATTGDATVLSASTTDTDATAAGAGAVTSTSTAGRASTTTDATADTDDTTASSDSSATGASGSSQAGTATTTTAASGSSGSSGSSGGVATTTSDASTSPAGATTTTVASLGPAPTDSEIGYPTGPDGTPLPVVAIFDTTTVTLSGQVPTEAAKDRLGALALANSQFPDVEVINDLVINPSVPISVGVRVIELNSARVPEGTASIGPEHALELDRVVTIMNALPNISVLVVGHADQRGDETKNFAISDERARAVINYLRYLGISPTRLSSRAAGASDLISIDDDDASLALNRRTEFIFYGLLIE